MKIQDVSGEVHQRGLYQGYKSRNSYNILAKIQLISWMSKGEIVQKK
jgi:hypothetical protein